jgi:hypothetical protein
VKEAVFGGFDGLTSVLGVIAAAYLAGSTHVLVVASLGLAIAAAVSMGGGLFLSETDTSKGKWRRTGIMTSATFVGCVIPALPFLFLPRIGALLVAGVLVLMSAVLIAQIRVPTHGIARAYIQTFAILLLAGGLSIGCTLLFNLAG